MNKTISIRSRRTHKNDLTNIPAAACGLCGGWTGFGGVSKHSLSLTPVLGRTGCSCNGRLRRSGTPS